MQGRKNNLIGIIGYKQVGKDTVGKIIQYLTSSEEYFKYIRLGIENEEDVITGNNVVRGSSYEIKQFSTKIKQFLSSITGIPLGDFEKEEVKNMKLGEEWFKKVWHISSKDNKALETFPSKEEAETFLPHWEETYGQSVFIEDENVQLTIRQALQVIGTDLFRFQFHPNTWVNALMADYKDTRWISKVEYDFLTTGKFNEEDDKPRYPSWLITDVRFPNEIASIKDRRGLIIKILRPGYEGDKHVSETALNEFKGHDYFIINNGSIKQLIGKVRQLLKKEKII